MAEERKKPTIEELEAILNDPTPQRIQLLPDGSICAVPDDPAEQDKRVRAEVLASAITLLDNVIYAESLVCHKTSGMELLQGIRKSLLNLQPAAKDLEEFEKKVQHESYGAARTLWIAGICDLLKIPKPKPDESGLEWLNREGGRALEELLQQERLKEARRLLVDTEPSGSIEVFKVQLRLRIAELKKARAIARQG